MLHRLLHGQPLLAGVLAGHNDIHIVAALDAVVKAAQQAVGIRRQIHPHHIRLLVGHMVQEAGVLVGEAVVVLLPHIGGEDIVEGGDVVPPGQLTAHLQPLGVLGKHGVHDADERLVAVKEAVTSGEQVALQKALAEMLGEHGVHHPPVGVQVVVNAGDLLVQEAAAGHVENGLKAVGRRFVRRKNAEVPGVHVQLHHIPDIGAENIHILGLHGAGGLDVHGVVPEIGSAQVPQQQTAVGVGICTHAPAARRGEGGYQLHRRTVGVEQLLRPIGPQPRLQLGQVSVRVRAHGDRHLMGPPAVLHRQSVHLLGACPALGGAQHDHGPAGTLGFAGFPGLPLDALDLTDRRVENGRHLLVHGHGVAALHKVGLPAAAKEEALHLLMAHAGEDGGVGDLEAVEVQNGQHRTVGNGVDELVAVPRGGQRAGFRLAVAHHAGGDQIGVIRHRAEGVGQGVAQLTALVDRAGGLRCYVAGNTAGEGEALKELLHSLLIPGDIGIHLRVAAV